MIRSNLRIGLITSIILWSFAVTHAKTLQPGVIAPNFTLPSQDATPVSLSQFKGKWVVLYFYPKDMSPGCSVEAHNFQRDQAKYGDANAVVLGVSLDSVKSHKNFCTKDSLSFRLLADPDRRVVDEYGVPTMFSPIGRLVRRDTFLISPAGKIVRAWTVKNINRHSEEVLAAIVAEKK